MHIYAFLDIYMYIHIACLHVFTHTYIYIYMQWMWRNITGPLGKELEALETGLYDIVITNWDTVKEITGRNFPKLPLYLTYIVALCTV